MGQNPTKTPRTPYRFTSADHDHGHCVATALDAAASLCQRRRARLTPLRRRVLELVWRSHEPQGAYDILDTLGERGRRAAPPTVYRALDFLLGQGLIHRIESLNAFVGCRDPDTPHAGQFLICTARLATAARRSTHSSGGRDPDPPSRAAPAPLPGDR